MNSDRPRTRPLPGNRVIDVSLVLASLGLISWALWLAFAVAPNERLMGPVQRLFYFHVASAFACYLAVAVVFVGSIGYLATRRPFFDSLSVASGEVGFLFCTVVLLSGMIWGHSAWNTWFRWEPRLVSFLFLWLILFSFVLLRVFGDPQRVAQHSAVLGILGAVTVPIVIYSIKLLPAMAQLHPQVVENRGLREPIFRTAMWSATLALLVLESYLVWLRLRIETLSREDVNGSGA